VRKKIAWVSHVIFSRNSASPAARHTHVCADSSAPSAARYTHVRADTCWSRITTHIHAPLAEEGILHQHTHPRTTSRKRAYHESIHSIPPAKRSTCTRACTRLWNSAATSKSLTVANLHWVPSLEIVPAAVCRPPRYWHDEHRRPPNHPRLQAAVPPAPLLARRTLSPTRVSAAGLLPKRRPPKNRPKSTPDHDSVAAAVSHKHHSIIRVGAGLLQFVHACTCTSVAEAISIKNPFRPFFGASFNTNLTVLATSELFYFSTMWNLSLVPSQNENNEALVLLRISDLGKILSLKIWWHKLKILKSTFFAEGGFYDLLWNFVFLVFLCF